MLWLTSRSQYEAGTTRCAMERYLRYHAGPAGVGFDLKGLSLPLATGTYTHNPLAPILRYIKDHGQQAPPDAVVRSAIHDQGIEPYKRAVTARGFGYLGEENPVVEFVLNEQCALIEGMIWAWIEQVLPWLLETYTIESVEEPNEYVADCTCGLGDGIGTFAEHTARVCKGIGLQSRLDLITAYRAAPDSYAYHELKTTGRLGPAWEEQWERKLQFAIGALGAERRLGKPIGEHYVHGFYKGYRKKKSKTEDLVIQHSSLVHPFCKLGSPPQIPDRWEALYDDEDRKPKRLNKSYQRRPIWEADFPDAAGAGMTHVEYWVRGMSPKARGEHVIVLGPFNRQDVLIEGVKDAVIGEERRWQQTCWALYEKAAEVGPGYWTNPDWMRLLHRLVPRSWECHRYGKKYACVMTKICFQEEGWEDPLGSGRYILRRPHHAPEIAQLRERGIELPEASAADEGNGDG